MTNARPPLVVDLETNGLHMGCRILGLGLYNDEVQIAKAYDEADGDELQGWFDTHHLIFHNAKFDVRVLREHGYTINDYDDTQVMAYAWDTSHESYSLNACLEREGLEQKIEFIPESELPAGYTNDVWLNAKWDDKMAEYCLQDVRQTWALYNKLRPRLALDPKALHHYETIDRPFIDCLIEMETVGLFIDQQRLPRIQRHLEKKTDGLLRTMWKVAGLVSGEEVTYNHKMPLGVVDDAGKYVQVGYNTISKGAPFCALEDIDKLRTVKGDTQLPKKYWRYDSEMKFDHCTVKVFNPNSNRHIITKLTELYGWEPTEFTPSGQPSTSADVLEDLTDMPLARLLVDYGTSHKILSSFIAPFAEKVDAHGVLRGNFNQTVTRTGRLSSSDPNLQNVPARGAYGHAVRSLVTVPNDDFVIVGIDLSNIEGRELADYLTWRCDDPVMTEVFKAGVDFHTENAFNWGFVELVSDKQTAQRLRYEYLEALVTKAHVVINKARNLAKTALYAVLYGAGDKKLGNGDEKYGALIRSRLEERAPSIPKLKEKVWAAARRRNGVIHTMHGRRLCYPDIIYDNALKTAQRLKRDKPDEYTQSVKSIARGLVSRAERQIFNALLQGSAADVIKMLTIRAMPLIRQCGAVLAAQVHDEILVYCPRSTAQKLREGLNELFTNDWAMRYTPCVGEAASGLTWADVH